MNSRYDIHIIHIDIILGTYNGQSCNDDIDLSLYTVYALVIPVRLSFATSSFAQTTGTHSDTVIGTALRRACGASCVFDYIY